MNPVCSLLLSQREPAAEVARRWDSSSETDHRVSWLQFREDVWSLRERLIREPNGPWILLTDDAYCFAVGLFALWHSGRYAISPPNRQPESLRSLQTRAVGVICDRPDWLPEGPFLHPLLDGIETNDFRELEPLARDSEAIELYTSGTTGGEKPIMKCISHLEDEVAEIEALWGEGVQGAMIFATASHQHLYGLLFGVLWPLGTHRVFHSRHFLHAEEAIQNMISAQDCVLASVPTHLKRLVRHGGTSGLNGVCRLIFSSGGPLQEATAQKIEELLEIPPIEVLGSTETGGIAWRSQGKGKGSDLWVCFPSVDLECESDQDVMRVSSPFVSVDTGDVGFVTGDRISLLADGTFRLEGRVDHVVKIGEKRIDLTRMESDLREHRLIDEVALLGIEKEAVMRVAAAVVPSSEGWRFLEDEGRRLYGREIRSTLVESWDPVMHPRYWRMVHQLPEDSVGKLTKEALAGLFSSAGFNEFLMDRPILLDEFYGSHFIERACQVPEDLSCFPGHFPGNPMVPGVLEIDWALDTASQLLGGAPRISKIDSLKFLTTLRPGDFFRVNVRKSQDGKLRLRIWGDDAEFVKGTISLAAITRAKEEVS